MGCLRANQLQSTPKYAWPGGISFFQARSTLAPTNSTPFSFYQCSQQWHGGVGSMIHQACHQGPHTVTLLKLLQWVLVLRGWRPLSHTATHPVPNLFFHFHTNPVPIPPSPLLPVPLSRIWPLSNFLNISEFLLLTHPSHPFCLSDPSYL